MMFLIMPKKKEPKTLFGKKLYQIRMEKGMNQHQLAQAIQSTQRAISSYETGNSYPPLPVIVDLAQALKVSADALMGLKENKPKKENQDSNDTRLWKKFQKVKDLPEKDQRAIIRMINSLASLRQMKLAS
jgi:transcriptional regulator with XRE-family HTH domain